MNKVGMKLTALLLCAIFISPNITQIAVLADTTDYSMLRQRWYDYIIGGNYDENNYL